MSIKIRSLRSVIVFGLTTLLTLVVLGFTLHPVSSFAQEQSLQRKVKSKVPPEYPEIARKMSLTGVVRLEVVISASGSVKETKVIGGHPILVNAAVDAVKKWKFETANSETIETVQVNFDQGY